MNILKTLVAAAVVTASAFAQYSTPVRDVDNAARNAVSFVYNCSNAGNCSTSFVIPAGYRLVVTQISADFVSTAARAFRFISQLQPAGQPAVTTAHVCPANTFDSASGTMRGTCNTFIAADMLLGSQSGSLANVSVSGYLVKM